MTTTWAALQDALAAEHAAIWAYGEIGAAVSDDLRSMVKQVDQTHRQRRATIESLLTAAGQAPVASKPGYQLPGVLTDEAVAVQTAAGIEDGLCAAWRFVLGQTELPEIRTAAAGYLTDCALQALRWRQSIVGRAATSPAFPGLG